MSAKPILWVTLVILSVWLLCAPSAVAAVVAEDPEPAAGRQETGVLLQDPEGSRPYTDVSGNITTNTTWTVANSPYRVVGNLTVNAGVTLTIDPGVRVEFNQWVGLWVDGTLQAAGTAGSPIVFTGSSAQSGWWWGIRVWNAGSATLDHVEVAYGGYSSSAGILKTGSGALSVQNSTIHHNSGDGLRVAAGYSAFTSANNSFHNHNYGVRVGLNASFDDDTSTYADNNVDVYLDGGTISQQVTWNLNPAYSLFVGSSVTVGSTGRLDILPGTTIKFTQWSGIWVDGTLNVGGAAAARGGTASVGTVYFTDWRDDAVGGDANGDGTSSAPAPGWWWGITVRNQGSATLEDAVVRYAGYSSAVGILKTGSGNLTMRDTTISNTGGIGLWVENSTGTTVLADAILTANTTGMRLKNAGTVTGADTQFRDNAQYGILQDLNDSFVYTGNTFSGNGIAGVGINGGTLNGSMTLRPAGNPFRILGNVTVGAGATLTTQPGVRVEVNQWTGLWVDGTLSAVGTAGSPIVFTGSSAQSGWWWGIHVQNAGSATLDHVEIAYAGYSSSAGILKTGSGSLSVQNSTIHHNSGDGLRVAAGYSAFISANNSFHNHNYGVRVGLNVSFDDDTSTYADNNVDVYLDGGTISQQVTWNLNPVYSLFVGSSVTVGANGRLDILSGTVVKFNQWTGLWVEGALNVNGTATGVLAAAATGPVYFTDWRDDTVGGDTNGDGNASAPAAGWWWSIAVQNAGAATLDHVVIRYAGYSSAVGVAKYGSGNLTIRNATISNTGGTGLWIDGSTGTTTLENATLRANTHGMRLKNAGAVTAAASQFRDNAQYGILQDVNDRFVYTGNTFSGNGVAGVGINGGIFNIDNTFSPAGNPFRVLGNITVAVSKTLTLEAGTQMVFNQWVGLWVDGNLHAVGSAQQPIVFTGSSQQNGLWWGIHVQNASSATLDYVEVAYAGYSSAVGILKSGNGDLTLRNSTIRNTNGDGLRLSNSTGHHDITRNTFTANGTGVLVQNQAETLFLVNNLIEGNTNFGVRNQNSATVYARYNWWGHASGPRHATINPDGQGNPVSDGVLFHPWNETRTVEQPVPEEVLVVSSGPARLSPGQTVDYAVTYNNLTMGAVQNSVLMVRLPALATYVESSAGGIYWPERHQVFWKLGNLALGAQGKQWVRVQYQWGIPNGQTDNTATLLVGSNYNAGLLDLAAYLNYTPPAVTASQSLSQSQWNALLAGAADLNALYTQALADGYVWASAERVTLGSGTVTQAILIHGQQRNVRVLYDDGVQAYAATFAPRHYSTTDGSGGLEWDIAANQQSVWGDWDLTAGAAWPGTRISPESCAGAGCCLSNCLSKVALTAVAGKLSSVVNTALATQACYEAYRTKTPQALANCAANVKEGILKVKNIPVLGELAGITECLAQCAGNPNSNDCTGDLITCEPSWTNLYEWLGVPSRTVWRCRSGCYSNLPEYIPCAFGDCCVPGVGCASGSGSHCRPERIVQARDPNEIHGPEGDLLPGQWVPYTIEYENVGAGTAYGVFITAELDEAFDAATLLLGGDGVYYPNVRLISWDIGDLAPKGEAGATGEVTMTVRLRNGLPSGTVVPNQAVVTFPSVPEETPTNTWVNLVTPVVATPQNLATNYMTPLPIVLAGREVSSLLLTYEIVEPPHGGTLSGVAPNLTYTPGANFTGADSFTFSASNGTSTSRPAQVTVEVTPAGDTTPPQILWTNPAANATGVIASAAPVFTDTVGPAYAPVILIGVSEPLSPTTVSTATVTLAREGGAAVTASVSFDGGANQVVLTPRAALGDGEYRVTVTTGVKDVAGNALAAAHTWRFTVGDPTKRIYLPLVLRN